VTFRIWKSALPGTAVSSVKLPQIRAAVLGQRPRQPLLAISTRLLLPRDTGKLIRMHDAVAPDAPHRRRNIAQLARAGVPTSAEVSLSAASALLAILSFPNFDLWFLAWVALVPLLVATAQTRKGRRAFLLGWLWGLIFFYGSCWWLTYPIIHYGHISAWFAYPLLLLPVGLVAIFPALFCLLLARLIRRFGLASVCMAPLIWVSLESARYLVTGMVWNALGYSQAFHPLLIQSARWGGVYTVSFLLVLANSAIALLVMRSRKLALALIVATALVVLAASYGAHRFPPIKDRTQNSSVVAIAIQPNVPMEFSDEAKEMKSLLDRHLSLSSAASRDLEQDVAFEGSAAALPRLVIWPESPMNFSYSRDSQLRDVVATLARTNHTSVLLNSLEPAPRDGSHNSAILVNQEGRIVAQYDKIRLMPFGEYVPLPHWLPGASSVRGIVGDFTPGSSYTLMPLGDLRAGVFICIEAAHPAIARRFTKDGADVLINISNDGYLGPTPVMRQHLSNAIFRAVENDRPLIRVTNSGTSAYIDSKGSVWDATSGFTQAVRTWTVRKEKAATTFYTRHGDIFVYACALISLGFISATFVSRPRRRVGN
jgi:apolipoprotein N-acyltransferase